MHVGLYSPRGSDPQKPHVQDEVYFVMRKAGENFLRGRVKSLWARRYVICTRRS